MKRFKISVNGNWHEVEIKDLDELPISVLVDGELFEVELEPEVPASEALARVSGECAALAALGPQAQGLRAGSVLEGSGSAMAEGEVIAPMPGKILAVNVSVGDRVKYGDVLCTLEAMKMENEIMTSTAGVIEEVRVAAGQDVLYGNVLFIIDVR